MSVDPAAVRVGQVRARYFRENFAQGGFDLAQVVPELVTNADAAIAASGRERGRITLYLGPPDPAFATAWKDGMRTLRAPALRTWRHELRCTDDGEGMDSALVDRRLGALGVEPAARDQRGLFGRGLRDVWLAQGGGRLESVRGGKFVEAWFFPASGDEPYAYLEVHDRTADARDLRRLGLSESGTRVTVPLAGRVPQPARFRTLISQLVQLRPVLEDPSRELWLELPGELPQQITFPRPDPHPEQPLLFDRPVDLGGRVTARIIVRKAAKPFTLSPSRATRLGGLVIRSGRAAHEVTLGSHAGRQGGRRLYGEVWCEAIERLQREALDSARPQVVVKVDRSGLNENHPMVARMYRAIDRVLAPIVAEEERREGARVIATDRALKRRDQQGLRALNDALRAAFRTPGVAPVASGGRGPGKAPPDRVTEGHRLGGETQPAVAEPPAPMWFKQSPMRLHPGEIRGAAILFDPARVAPGTPVDLAADEGLWVSQRSSEVPPSHRGRPPRIPIDLRARVSVEPGTRLAVLAEAGEHTAELEIVVVRHTASGWVREIVRKDRDSEIEAEFDPESGVVTVYEGRAEFRDLERAARHGRIAKRRVREYLPYRMLEVEVAANAVYSWAAEQIVARRLTAEPYVDPGDYARAVLTEAQRLRHGTHRKLMHAFLDSAVFEGRVRVEEAAREVAPLQASLNAG